MFDDAQKLLNELIDSQSLQARGLVGFWPAQSVGDDIHVYAQDTVPRSMQPVAKFHGLRQQVTLPLYGFFLQFLLLLQGGA